MLKIRTPENAPGIASFLRFVRASWRSADSCLRRGAVAMWVLGFVLAAAGYAGDLTGFWSDKPFTTNLLTSLTAFFFAVPVALLLLQAVNQRQALRAGRVEAEAMFEESLTALREIAAKVGGRPGILKEQSIKLGKAWQQLDRQRRRCLQQEPQGRVETGSPSWQEAHQVYADALSNPDHLTDELGALQDACSRLLNRVRPRLLQLDLAMPEERAIQQLADACDAFEAAVLTMFQIRARRHPNRKLTGDEAHAFNEYVDAVFASVKARRQVHACLLKLTWRSTNRGSPASGPVQTRKRGWSWPASFRPD